MEASSGKTLAEINNFGQLTDEFKNGGEILIYRAAGRKS